MAEIIQKTNNLSDIMNIFGVNLDTYFDGKIRRFAPHGKRSKSGWYVGNKLGDLETIVFGDWSKGEGVYLYSSKLKIPKEVKPFYDKMIEDAAALRKKEEENYHLECKKINEEVFNQRIDFNHSEYPYFQKKQINDIYGGFFAKEKDGKVFFAVPLMDENGSVWNYQRIYDDGSKFFKKGRSKGLFHIIGDNETETVFICEGFATGASIHQATKCRVIVCFSANNLFEVCSKLNPKTNKFIVAADNDKYSKENAGVKAAGNIFKTFGIEFRLPKFLSESNEPTDFNDMYIEQGPESVAALLTGCEEFKPCFFREVVIPQDDGPPKIFHVPEYMKMAEYMFKKRAMTFDDSQSYIFNGTHWDWLSKNELYNIIIEHNKEHIKPNHLDGFSRMIKGKCLDKAFKFKDKHAKINLKNGILDVISGELTPHSNDYMFRNCVNVTYDKSAQCPEWLRFLNFVLQGSKDVIEVVQKMFGYVLIDGDPFLHKAFVLYGTGRNGKSTLLRILKELIGFAGCSSVSMANLNRPFSAVLLDGKLANIVEETPTDEINAEIFKTAVGGGEITAAHKGFDEYPLKVNARFIFACNDMPVFKDKSKGLLDRLLFIPFNIYIDEKDRDTNKVNKLLMEMSGILNWSLEGARMVLEDRAIKAPQACEELKESYREETDPMYSWFQDCIEVVEDSSLNYPNNVIYKHYAKDCEESGMGKYSAPKFFKRLHQMLKDEARQKGLVGIDFIVRPRIGKKQVKAIKNIIYYDRTTDSEKTETTTNDKGQVETVKIRNQKLTTITSEWEKKFINKTKLPN